MTEDQLAIEYKQKLVSALAFFATHMGKFAALHFASHCNTPGWRDRYLEHVFECEDQAFIDVLTHMGKLKMAGLGSDFVQDDLNKTKRNFDLALFPAVLAAHEYAFDRANADCPHTRSEGA